MLSIRRAKRTTLVVLFVLVVSGLPTVQSEHIPDGAAAFEVVFHQNQGVKFEHQVNLTGSSTIPMRNTTWSIVNISGQTPITVLSGPFLTSVVPVAEGDYRWALVVDLGSVSCTCYVELRVEDADHVVQTASLVMYVGSFNHRPVLLDELVMFSQGPVGVTSPIILKDAIDVDFGLALAGNDTTDLQVFSDICEAPYEVCLTAPRRVNLPFELGTESLVLKLNASLMGLQEGIWRVDIWAVDAALRSTGLVRMHILHDNTPPVANLSSDQSVMERESFQVYADVDDGYEGAQASLTWVIGYENGSTRAPMPWELQSTRHLVLQFNESGTYSIVLTAMDKAGNSVKVSQTVRIDNIRPTARVTVDGLLVSSTSQVKLGPENNWTINGSESIDNEPIDYLWVIDDTSSIRGVSSLTRSDFASAGAHSVELIVFDDDGATDTTVVNVLILEESNSLTTSNRSYAMGVTFVVVLLATGVLLYRRSESPVESDLPKWDVQRTFSNASANSDFDHDLDATVEEDKPRG